MPRFYLLGPTDLDPPPSQLPDVQPGDRMAVRFGGSPGEPVPEEWIFTVEEGEAHGQFRARVNGAVADYRAAIATGRPEVRAVVEVTGELEA